jgi:hypothetical protein
MSQEHMTDTKDLQEFICFVDEWLTTNAPFLPGHVVDFALDVRGFLLELDTDGDREEEPALV